MEVKGANFGQYDARQIQQVQREIARSVKPNVLRDLEDRDLDEATFQKILSEDLVDLSPDAKALLQQLRKERRAKGGKRKTLDLAQQDFLSLLEGLDQLRRQVEEDNEREGLSGQFQEKPFLPTSIPLSNHVPDAPRRRSRTSIIEDTPAALSPAAELARKMIAYAPRPSLKETMAQELQVFGLEVIGQVKKFGVRAVILDRNMALTDLKIRDMHVVAPSEKTFDGRSWSQVRGLYDPSRRMLVVGEELVGLNNRSTARHEFAHAYDHVFSEKNGRRLPLSVQLWNSFNPTRSGMVSDYAATNPAEYFAESVEAFFQSGARDHLRFNDPLMFEYLTKLFA